MNYLFFQQYWWILVALIGAILVTLLFVQGGQSLIFQVGKTSNQRSLIVNTIGRKWEFTFTTLVVFGGAIFAAFPLFYAVSFGGAYWVWMLLLFSFILQAVSYEYRSKPRNFLGKQTYDLFLTFNGIVATIVLGVAVGTFFNGANFSLNEFNQSTWDGPWHGLEALLSTHNLSLGLSVFFLSRILGLLYFIKTIEDDTIEKRSRKHIITNAILFLLCFLPMLIALLLKEGYSYDATSLLISTEPYKYWNNLIELPSLSLILVVGISGVLTGIYKGGFSESQQGIFYAAGGTFFTVFALLLMAGLNHTCFYPSIVDPQSSLHIQNASSSLFSLQTLSVVSLFIPFIVAYIWYIWHIMTKKKIDEKEIVEKSDTHIY